MDNLANRDKIRFAELFKDYTESKDDHKDFVMIQKREYNPELSLFSNLVLDLVDFKDRVRPLAKDIALMDITRPYQKQNVNALLRDEQDFQETVRQVQAEIEKEALEEGYSSREIEGPDSRKHQWTINSHILMTNSLTQGQSVSRIRNHDLIACNP